MTVIRTRFDNGLTLLCEERREAPVVALQAWVNVGSADEPEELAGVAHVHEHMLFKGTERRGVGLIAGTVEGAGGEINAWTSYDQTVYHLVLASREVDTGLDILADALSSSTFDPAELGRELEVVIEEIRRADDMPARRISKALFGLAYTRHPYRRPVIGYTETVRALTRERILAFYRKHYRPERVTLIAVGDVDPAHVETLTRRLLGSWRQDVPLASEPRPGEPEQTDLRVRVLEEPVKETSLAVAWHLPGVLHDDVPAIDALSVILGHGESARLFAGTRRRDKLANDVYAYAYTPREPGLLMAGAGLRAENAAAALASVLSETYALRRRAPTAEELTKAKVIIDAESSFQSETVQGRARRLGFFEVVAGDYAAEEIYRARLQALGAEDVRRAAERYLGPDPSIVLQMPQGAAISVDAAREVAEKSFGAAKRSFVRERTRDRREVTRVVLDNGAVLLAKRDESPVVAVRAAALGGLRWEEKEKVGIGSLFAALWGLATEDLTADGMARRIALLGAQVAAFTGRNTVGLRAELLADRAQEGLELVAEVLTRAALGAQDLERERAVQLERIRNREDNPVGVAYDLFARELYPTHPYGLQILGTEQSVGRIGLDDVLAYRRFVAPDKLVVAVVGGIEPERVVGELAERLGKEVTEALAEPPRVDLPPSEPRQAHRALEKEQAHLIIGSMGTTVEHPDRFALEVLTTALSGQGGRLFLDLRDRQSLAYALSSSSLEGLDPGYVLVHIGTSPDKLEQARTSVYAHLARLCAEPLGPNELERAKRYLIGTHAIDLQRAGARAMLMALNERYGLGYDAHERYAENIGKVSAEWVQEVARRYLARERLLEVVVGPNR